MFKVMIADDEKIAIDSLKFIIERSFADAEVIATARSGREAIEKVGENAPDILFMDIHMPGINGIEAIREIRKHHTRMAIIILTAFDQFEFAKEAVNLGVMEYLLKPVNRAKVVEVAGRAMSLIRAGKEKRQMELELQEKLKSAEESLKALRCLQGSGILHLMDITARAPGAGSEYPEYKEKLLLQKVAAGDAAESINAFSCIFDWLKQEYRNQPLKIKNKLLEIVFLINHMSWEYEPADGADEDDYLEEMLSIDDLEELRLWCKKRLENGIDQINFCRDYKAGGLTKRAKEYIKENYSKCITQEDVAREINVSPQYLSKLFKEETGENFIDYLTGIRIGIAKTLLEGNELSVKEICYSIGYSDPNYFSRIFKKIAGVTPTEYKDEFLNRTSQV